MISIADGGVELCEIISIFMENVRQLLQPAQRVLSRNWHGFPPHYVGTNLVFAYIWPVHSTYDTSHQISKGLASFLAGPITLYYWLRRTVRSVGWRPCH